MSNQLYSGQGRDINVPAGQSLAVSSITGTYTATIIAGAGIGTALATDSTGGATYGPYSGGVTVRLKAGEGALLDYEAAVNPVLNYAGPARLGYSAAGDTSSVVDAGGKKSPIGRDANYLASVFPQPSRQMSKIGSPGVMVCDFQTGWSIGSGAPVLTAGYTGYDANGVVTGIQSRTGIPTMLKVVPSSDASEEIQNTTFTPIALNGKFGLWVYVQAQPGFQAGVGTGTGTIGVLLSTDAVSFSNALQISFIATGFREGWNFLKYDENAQATVGHPAGINRVMNGTGANGNIIANTVKRMKIITSTLNGATVYLDSMWTGFTSRTAIVLGSDSGGIDAINIALPTFQANGWQNKGYLAIARQVWASGSKIVTDWSVNRTYVDTMYAAGFEVLNHSTNHLANGLITNAGEIAYEVDACRGWSLAQGWVRGSNFYAAPLFSTSRLAIKVINDLGFLMQRNARKYNIARTPWGIDNPDYLGSIDMGQASQGWQQFSTIKAAIDKCVFYGDSLWPFWHSITELGDPGTGEGLTGDDLLIYKSNWLAVMAYIKQLESAGTIDVLSPTEFYYGSAG